jgi:hypothetical protein
MGVAMCVERKDRMVVSQETNKSGLDRIAVGDAVCSAPR